MRIYISKTELTSSHTTSASSLMYRFRVVTRAGPRNFNNVSPKTRGATDDLNRKQKQKIDNLPAENINQIIIMTTRRRNNEDVAEL